MADDGRPKHSKALREMFGPHRFRQALVPRRSRFLPHSSAHPNSNVATAWGRFLFQPVPFCQCRAVGQSASACSPSASAMARRTRFAPLPAMEDDSNCGVTSSKPSFSESPRRVVFPKRSSRRRLTSGTARETSRGSNGSPPAGLLFLRSFGLIGRSTD